MTVANDAMPKNTMNPKRKAVLERIESLQQAIGRAQEYLESGKYANWSGFKPLFVHKLKDGKELPPHKDWVRNVFLPGKEKALMNAEKVVVKLENAEAHSHAAKANPRDVDPNC